jgi:hypothetical protein
MNTATIILIIILTIIGMLFMPFITVGILFIMSDTSLVLTQLGILFIVVGIIVGIVRGFIKLFKSIDNL